MALQSVLLLIGLALLTAGAELLVRGGSSFAKRLGLTPLVIGLTIVAFGTSAPEMVVSFGASLKGAGDIAAGNVIGSNIFNIGIILGLAALITPVHIRLALLKIDAPVMIAATVLGAWLITFAAVPRAAGAALVLLLVGYTVFNVRMARKESAAAAQEFEEGTPPLAKSVVYDLLFIAFGLGLLFAGSTLLVGAATTIARALGLSEAIIGLTIVAAGTSMPELATSLIAAVRGQADISVGNVVGSNIFNILGILGGAAVLNPLSAPGISQVDLWVMIIFAVALLPLMYTGAKIQRWEGAALLAGYMLYLWMLWPTE